MATHQDKTYLITGATNGIGKAAALAIAATGARLMLAGRSKSKMDATIAEIQAAVPGARLEPVLADLSLIAGSRDLAGQVLARTDRLDGLLNNAGGYFAKREVTAEGHEMTFALNHLSYFVLANLLQDLLQQTARAAGEARVVNVSSDAHKSGKIDFDDIERAKRYSSFAAYGGSKLMNVLFSNELARRLAGTGVTSNAVHPGAVATGFGRNNGGAMGLVVRAMGPFMLSPEQGADTLVYVATSADVRGQTGLYWVKRKAVQPSAAAQDEAAARRLWDISEALTGIHAAAAA